MKTIIIMAKSIKEAKQFATKNYGADNWKYLKPFSYASPGNNFYEFDIINYPEN